MTITLKIHVSDIVAAMVSYDVIRVERQTAPPTGPTEELTEAAAEAATLLGSNTGSFTIIGQTLQLKVDSDPQVDVVFAGVDPLTIGQVVDQINTAVGAVVASNESGQLRLTSLLTGTASKLEVVGGSAATTLGFTAGDRDIGAEEYITLVGGQSEYFFSDDDGQAGYLYRVWFYHTVTGLQSQKSEWFEGAVGTQISSANLSVGSIDLVDARGVAMQGQVISFYSLAQPLEVEGFAVALSREPIVIETDTSGHAEVTLVRGVLVRVVFEGTSLIREITVPDAATFDILGLVGTAPDIFQVVEPNLPAAPRRVI